MSVKTLLKHYSKKQFEDLQEALKDKDYELHLMTIYTPSELAEIKNYKYVSPFKRIINIISEILYQYKNVLKILGIGIIVLFLSIGIIKLFNAFSYDNSIRNSDYWEQKLENGR